jgi:shikimate dehydrogenase
MPNHTDDRWVPTGKALVVLILGHPIAQVRSPSAVNAELARRGRDAVLVPMDVEPQNLAAALSTLRAWRNCCGAIITVPHKIAAAAMVDRLSARASLLGAVNLVRRAADTSLEGDMIDGDGFLAALSASGRSVNGASVVMFGGGGVGRALLLALLSAGVKTIAAHEPNEDRRQALQAVAEQIGASNRLSLDAMAALPSADIAINATPLGMSPADALPFDPRLLKKGAHVADVVTSPEITPLLQEALACGLSVQTGRAMAEAQMPLQIAYFGFDKTRDGACRE